jgi:hypothetical protein
MRASLRAVATLLVATAVPLVVSTASAQDLYYLRTGTLLSPEAPPSGAATALLSTKIPAGENALLATFTSAMFAADVVLSDARAVVFLGTGRPGMDGCARVTATLGRLAGAAQATVASGTIVTTIRPRRRVTDPIIVPLAVSDATLAAPGDRIVLQVRVTNECGGERNVSVMYDSVGRPSRVELLVNGATTTTTTTTTLDATTSTTTTLPPSCLVTATELAAVRCRLEAMDGILRGTSPADLGGARFRDRLERRVERALALARAAELLAPTKRRLKRARKQLARFAQLVDKGRGDGRVATEVGGTLSSLAQGATSGLDALLASE